MFRALVILSFASLLLAAAALISCLSVEDKQEIRGLPRWVWVLAILLVPLGGAVAWFLFGRPRPQGGPAFGWPGLAGPREPRQQRPPDDDPDFLRSLDDHRASREEQEMLRRWEEDLRRREDEQRHRDPGSET